MHDNRDRSAFFSAHRRALIRYAQKIVRDEDEAEDIVQDAWLRFDSVAKSKTPHEPVSFLYRIVRNLAIDAQRKVVRESKIVPFKGGPAAEIATERVPMPTVDLAARDELVQLRKVLEELPEQTRIALRMKRLGGHPLREIAEYLGISITATHRLILEGAEYCRSRIRPGGEE